MLFAARGVALGDWLVYEAGLDAKRRKGPTVEHEHLKSSPHHYIPWNSDLLLPSNISKANILTLTRIIFVQRQI